MAVHSTMLPLGTRAPDFTLPDPEGSPVSLDGFGDAKALVVVFLSNHCPYVQHLRAGVIGVAERYAKKGVAFVGINANDTDRYPADAPERMAAEGYPFPYLFDRTQETARAYHAACTPDFYLFDGERRLVYRGRFDASRPGNDVPVTGQDLRAAMDALLEDRPIPAEQAPSIGCGIKWRPGSEPGHSG
jgi:peroxiredoxin